MHVTITRNAAIPDPVKLARYRRTPELGPQILFFSGGTALRDLSREIIRSTHNTTHLITPFDSGGSSAVLRRAFHMPAIGDVRNRLMALADLSFKGNHAIFALFAHRLDKDRGHPQLLAELESMIRGRHPLVEAIPDPMRRIIRRHLERFREVMPQDFDLRGASIGNLVLTAGYLDNQRKMDPVIYIFSKLVEVRGTVRPILNTDLHLIAELQSGRTVAGQHLLTGKEAPPLDSKVSTVYLSKTLENPTPCSAPIRRKTEDLIRSAELICYPPGSFFSSLLANLLPSGVGRTVADTRCPKVFIPNTGHDPELYGLSLMDQVTALLDVLQHDQETPVPVRDLLDFILVDAPRGGYAGDLDTGMLDAWGVRVLDLELITPESAPLLDAHRLAEVLLSLC